MAKSSRRAATETANAQSDSAENPGLSVVLDHRDLGRCWDYVERLALACCTGAPGAHDGAVDGRPAIDPAILMSLCCMGPGQGWRAPPAGHSAVQERFGVPLGVRCG